MKFIRNCLYHLQANLPANRRVYFIYTHRNGYNRFQNGLRANTEISYWCFSALKRQFPSVRFLRYQDEKPERIRAIRSQDVVVGHIGPTFGEASRYTKRLIAFNPWAGHEDRSQDAFNCAPKEMEMGYFEKCCSLVLLTSEYNKREYFEKNRNYWYPYLQELQKTKRVRLVHQPIDLTLFTRIKWNYTTDNFLYIGNDAHMKCVDDTIALVEKVGRKLALYGCHGSKIDHRDGTQVARLPKEADFFIQPGMWEAQCVSILESAARGFIPLVSEETGYPYSHPYLLRYNDFDYNLRILKEVLHLSGKERRELADRLHQQLVNDVNHNNWKKLTDVLVEEVKQVFIQSITD